MCATLEGLAASGQCAAGVDASLMATARGRGCKRAKTWSQMLSGSSWRIPLCFVQCAILSAWVAGVQAQQVPVEDVWNALELQDAIEGEAPHIVVDEHLDINSGVKPSQHCSNGAGNSTEVQGRRKSQKAWRDTFFCVRPATMSIRGNCTLPAYNFGDPPVRKRQCVLRLTQAGTMFRFSYGEQRLWMEGLYLLTGSKNSVKVVAVDHALSEGLGPYVFFSSVSIENRGPLIAGVEIDDPTAKIYAIGLDMLMLQPGVEAEYESGSTLGPPLTVLSGAVRLDHSKLVPMVIVDDYSSEDYEAEVDIPSTFAFLQTGALMLFSVEVGGIVSSPNTVVFWDNQLEAGTDTRDLKGESRPLTEAPDSLFLQPADSWFVNIQQTLESVLPPLTLDQMLGLERPPGSSQSQTESVRSPKNPRYIDRARQATVFFSLSAGGVVVCAALLILVLRRSARQMKSMVLPARWSQGEGSEARHLVGQASYSTRASANTSADRSQHDASKAESALKDNPMASSPAHTANEIDERTGLPVAVSLPAAVSTLASFASPHTPQLIHVTSSDTSNSATEGRVTASAGLDDLCNNLNLLTQRVTVQTPPTAATCVESAHTISSFHESQVTPASPKATAQEERRIPRPTELPAAVRAQFEDLHDALDTMLDEEAVLYGRFRVLGPTERRVGGQGLVQFVACDRLARQFAVKFFLHRSAFEHERQMLTDPSLREVVADSAVEICSNEDSSARSTQGYVFPPSIVMERGQSLNEWLRSSRPQMATIVDAMLSIVRRLHLLHEAGVVHRDIKPGNLVRLVSQREHGWALIDFGSAARVGTKAPLSFSLKYAAPETITAFESGSTSVEASPAVDIWSVGVICLELVTHRPVFDPITSGETVRACLAGRSMLPWEDPAQAAQVIAPLKSMRRTVTQCLNRNPDRRPTAAQLMYSWEHIFDSTTTVAALSNLPFDPGSAKTDAHTASVDIGGFI